VSISSTFYSKLLCTQAPKAQKYSQAVSLFALLGSAREKAACKTVMKLTPPLYPQKISSVISLLKKRSPDSTLKKKLFCCSPPPLLTSLYYYSSRKRSQGYHLDFIETLAIFVYHLF